MKITFFGATHEVTGSCTLIEIGGRYLLIDCGMEQGADIFVNQELPINPGLINCVLLTHAHIDHSGNLPLLCKNGFSGEIFATSATCSLAGIMLLDSAHIQEFEAEWKNRKAKRSGDGTVEPVYDTADAQKAISLLNPCRYGEWVTPMEGVRAKFHDAGHLLGSASIEIELTEGGVTKTIVFSGDVGNFNRPLINDPHYIKAADYAVIESTYGDRLHDAAPDYVGLLAALIQKAFDRGGNVVIPSFAVGRTQEILYFIRNIKQNGLIKGHDGFPVYVDSPLAVEATKIFLKCDESNFDADTLALLKAGVNPISFEGLITSVTSDDSKAINFDTRPKVIISASGMCEAGRIRHHLKHNLWRAESLILFVGYQSEGTLGRALFDGAKSVKLFGEEIAVNAEVTVLPGVSGHADRDGLIKWITAFEKKPSKVFVNHGEDAVCTGFAKLLNDSFGFDATAPYSGASFDLADGRCLIASSGVAIDKSRGRQLRSDSVFARLMAAAERLLKTVKASSGVSNKELALATDKINAVSDRLERK